MEKFNGIPRDVMAYALVLAYGKTRQTLEAINFLARDEDTIIYKPSKKIRPPESYARELNARHEFFRDVMELLSSVQTDEGGTRFDGFFRVEDVDRLDQLTRDSNAHDHPESLESAWEDLTNDQRWIVRLVSAFFFESLLRRTTDPAERQSLYELRQELIDEQALESAVIITDHAERLHPGEELVRLIDYVERLTWFGEPPVTGSEPAILYGSFAGMLTTQAKQLAEQYPDTEHD